MPASDESNSRLPSTRWVWKKVRVPAPPEGPPARAASAASPPVSRRNPRESLTVTVRYRGGAECWWQVEARGRVWRTPGVIAIHDVMTWINEGQGGKLK